KHGERPTVLLADDHGEQHSLWLLHTALRASFRRLKPQRGDRIGVKRLGERAPRNGGKPYVDWRVVLADGGPLNWDDTPDADDDDQPPL
ncbi:MAG TPA: hypothetical protein VKG45_15390, partial [Actinomycetes bacterium]|nr:hypothetical protein [Actinomycetes bacterium]